MLALPVISREMLVASRNPLNYRGRAVIGVVAGVFLAITLIKQTAGMESGAELFAAVDLAIVFMLLIVGPLMTADSISKERREGTLDLLFLTSLTASKVIGSKFTARLLQLLSLWLVIVPLSVVPILAGGVSGKAIVGSLLKQMTIILVSLGAGLVASCMVRRALAAMLLALGLAAPLLWLVTKLNTLEPPRVPFAAAGIQFVHEPEGLWSFSQVFFHQGTRWGFSMVLSVLLTLLLLRVAAQLIVSGRKEKTESETRKSLRVVFFTPHYWKSGFHRWLSRKMDKNPLIWLEYRRTGSRAARWMMVLVLVMVETYAVMAHSLGNSFLALQLQTAFLLMLIMAVTAASSFQKEMENGAFELLLVAPFTERSLLSGRLRAVWSYYLPPLLTLALPIWMAFTWNEARAIPLRGEEALGFARVMSLAGSAITIPVCGLFFALTSRGFLLNLIGTVLFALVVPYYFWEYLLGIMTYFVPQYGGWIWMDLFGTAFNPSSFPYVSATIALHAGLGAVFYIRAFQSLRARQFA